ncbi:MAG: nicotinate-nucleotide--dimethylbenzimidazole phosphoribosyltransferase [Deltaproteobacteria bacterium]|nr:MAG: nicotinate-nucleotide--dimethylbenzimidazole phosphoribosyltransferase [Deltaproteobacteria bacterium]
MKLTEIISSIEGVNQAFIEKARERTSQLVMPSRALGELHSIGERLCGINRTLSPSVKKKAFLVMAGDHGITASGVSAYPQDVTAEMVKTFLRGGAGINVLSRQLGASVLVMDVGIISEIPPQDSEEGRLIVSKVAKGTRDFTKGPAMTRGEAGSAILKGFEAAKGLFDRGVDLLGTGDMGIGNTSPSSAIGAVITGQPVEKMTGRGAGVDDEGLRRKAEMIKRGIEVNDPKPDDPLDVLAKVGGFEIGAIAGAILAGAFSKTPVVIDGFISGAGALIAHGLCPSVTDYLFAGHLSEEQGHKIMLDHMGLAPILDLGMRLGEGTGAALAMHIIEAAARVIKEVFTFEQAGVSGKI